MIIGAGIGEGEQSTGAASTVVATAAATAAVASTPALTDMASVRTRLQLERCSRSSSEPIRNKEEDIDESLLDEDSESEDRMQTDEKMEKLDTKAGSEENISEDVFEADQGDLDEDDVSASAKDIIRVVPAPALNIGSGHSTVKAARRAASSLRQLNPSPNTSEVAKFRTSFTNGGDERILRCNISHNLRDRTSTSISFDTKRQQCNTCVSGAHGALAGRGGRPIVVVAADQSFPACIPATDTGECIRVVRVEDGSLQEVIHALADAVGHHKLGTGTVIALGSISHLAEVGSSQYITDWVRSRNWIKGRFGDSTVVIPLIPVLSHGWDGRSTVRALLEVLHWFMSISDTEAVLMKGIIQLFVDRNLATSTGRGWADGRQCLRAPASFDTKASVSLVSEGWGCRPDAIPALSQAAEQEIILAMIAMLNEAFGTNLCTEPLLYRMGTDWKAAVTNKAKKLFIAVIGGSNANRVAERMEQDGLQIFRLTTPGWRITRQGIEEVVRTIASLDPQPDCLIVQALDNSAFYCLQEDGTLSLPKKSLLDGRYHVKGELKVASEEQTKALLRLLLPLFRAVPGAKLVLVTCLPRYTHAPCCKDSSHMVGMDAGSSGNILDGLVQMKKHIRSFLAKENLSQLKLVDPIQLMEGVAVEGHVDPVHPPEELYDKLASRLTIVLEGDGKSSPEAGQEPDPKRIRLLSYGTVRGGARGGSAQRGGWRGGNRGGRYGRGKRVY